ncbi:rRNA processing/ribosome biogenesis-domain-containing protein [Cyathus striatus]|nr:rRNA processing/ribosome biogenesis-domain-containing protein [Cyathus striatus]
MEDGYLLKLLLQIQLASDISAAQNLPFVLNSLTTQSFFPSPHLAKWTTRVNSLLHSKEACARWAGLCIAHKTSVCSRSIMIEFGRSWLGVALPLLSKNEQTPVIKAAIRLARIIFTSLTDMSEFQRQVSNPNVPKFIASLIQTAQNTPELEVKLECIWTLHRLVPVYPAAHRASHSALSKLALIHLNGNTSGTSQRSLVEACSALYCVLHFTGGKVGASGLWRNSFDETLNFGWSSFLALRTTFPSSDFHNSREQNSHEDPSISVPLNLERLRCSIVILCDFLKAITHRHVQLPLGSIVQFASALLTANAEAQVDGFVDPIVRSMEMTAIPSITKYGSQLLHAITFSARSHLRPHAARLLTIISQCLEGKPTLALLVVLFGALDSLLKFSPSAGSPLILNRVTTAVISFISARLLSSQSSLSDSSNEITSGKSKKSKKRARNYEGDEVFSVMKEVICPTEDEGKALLAALTVLHHLLQNEDLPPAILSICSRTVLSLNLSFPQIAPTLLSPDSGLFPQVHTKLRSLAITIACGTSGVLSKSLPLVLETITNDSYEEVQAQNCNFPLYSKLTPLQRMFDLILHPRVPPLLRSMPTVEALSLYISEESQEEKRIRETLGLEAPQHTLEDAMRDDENPRVPTLLIPSLGQSVPTPENPPVASATQHDSAVAVRSKITPIATPIKQPGLDDTGHKTPLSQNIYPQQSSTQQLPGTTLVPLSNDDSENDDEDEMPTINMASDSEEDL